MAAGDVMRRVREGYRMEKPDHCKREVYNILFYCWDEDPLKRPTFGELVKLLDKLLVVGNQRGTQLEKPLGFQTTEHSSDKLSNIDTSAEQLPISKCKFGYKMMLTSRALDFPWMFLELYQETHRTRSRGAPKKRGA
ncbi:tyrosine kinase receptor Cad96Ca [Trichonephila inaurata madagascariensis]|uniref:Tyrosine kinase receptor Cad96Ca n=1 Tax=Trichonephila inaurata madagascariensis TaxID=2747483 RepID=A0A8X7CGD4_9ARAC|nr:tyrosine kinase receptor Cad96Ca [Trichonephila inaurata madagascariensis]